MSVLISAKSTKPTAAKKYSDFLRWTTADGELQKARYRHDQIVEGIGNLESELNPAKPAPQDSAEIVSLRAKLDAANREHAELTMEAGSIKHLVDRTATTTRETAAAINRAKLRAPKLAELIKRADAERKRLRHRLEQLERHRANTPAADESVTVWLRADALSPERRAAILVELQSLRDESVIARKAVSFLLKKRNKVESGLLADLAAPHHERYAGLMKRQAKLLRELSEIAVEENAICCEQVTKGVRFGQVVKRCIFRGARLLTPHGPASDPVGGINQWFAEARRLGYKV